MGPKIVGGIDKIIS